MTTVPGATAGLVMSAETYAALARLTVHAIAVAVEESDGPRWSEALREGRRLRERAWSSDPRDDPLWRSLERAMGCPLNWISRP